METSTDSTLKPQELTSKILWGALFITHFIFLGITHFLRPEGMESMTDSSSLILRPEFFYALAAVNLFLSQILPKAIARGMLPKNHTESVESDSYNKSRVYAALLPAMIIELALLESISLFGFLLGYLQGRLDLHRGFFLVAIFFVLRAFPRSIGHMKSRYLG